MGHIIITYFQQPPITLHDDPMGTNIISKNLLTSLRELINQNTSIGFIFRSVAGEEHNCILNPHEIQDHMTYMTKMGSSRIIRYDKNGIKTIQKECAQTVTPEKYEMLLVQDLIKSKISKVSGCPKQFTTLTEITAEENEKPVINYMHAEPNLDEINQWIKTYYGLRTQQNDYLDAMRRELTTAKLLEHLLSTVSRSDCATRKSYEKTLKELIKTAEYTGDEELAKNIWKIVFFSPKRPRIRSLRASVLKHLIPEGQSIINLQLPDTWPEFKNFMSIMEYEHDRPQQFTTKFAQAIPQIIKKYMSKGEELDEILTTMQRTFTENETYKKNLKDQLVILMPNNTTAENIFCSRAHDATYWPNLTEETYKKINKKKFKRNLCKLLQKDNTNHPRIRNPQMTLGKLTGDVRKILFQDVKLWEKITQFGSNNNTSYIYNRAYPNDNEQNKIGRLTGFYILLINSYFDCLENENDKHEIFCLLLKRIASIPVSYNTKKWHINMLLNSCVEFDTLLSTAYRERNQKKWKKFFKESLICDIADVRVSETGITGKTGGAELYNCILGRKTATKGEYNELYDFIRISRDIVYPSLEFRLEISEYDLKSFDRTLGNFKGGTPTDSDLITICALLHAFMDPYYNIEPLQQLMPTNLKPKWMQSFRQATNKSRQLPEKNFITQAYEPIEAWERKWEIGYVRESEKLMQKFSNGDSEESSSRKRRKTDSAAKVTDYDPRIFAPDKSDGCQQPQPGSTPHPS